LSSAIGGEPRDLREQVARKANPLEAPTGIEPVEDLFRFLEPKVRLYAEHFREASGAAAPNV
jgi:hypothetical protein